MSTIFSQRAKARLQANTSKIFTQDDVDVMVLNVTRPKQGFPDCPSVTEEHLKSSRNVETYIHEITNSRIFSNTLFVIPQEHSWSRLKITEAAFGSLVGFIDVFPQFLDLVSAFGTKTSEDERLVHGWRSCSEQQTCLQKQHELCYNIQYVEKHGRKLQDPWSVRQVGVYHQLCENVEQSRWLLLGPMQSLLSSLKNTIASEANSCYLTIHAALLLSTSTGWPEYIEYLKTELQKHDDKACYSAIKQGKSQGFTVSYLDLQNLHILQAKFNRAKAAIENSVDIAEGCLKHALASEHSASPVPAESTNLINVYIVEMRGYKASLERLNRQLDSTLDLLSKILAFRNGELLNTSVNASGKMLQSLVDLTNQGKEHQETLAFLATTGQADSAILKALAVVATVCLPASLVATVFSSSLIQSVGVTEEVPANHIVVASQFWIYLVISLPLMAITLLWILYLGRKSRLDMYSVMTRQSLKSA
ncbi:hypothetical protein H072_9064 [Dactylellina haptotyla CBS 200.50]|uniref:CorA-like transporter domain-containing protein n=1 Tax=Dactylellina haptotyla (strain CBS 200.50) TaxID=1284197 RepID=S8BPU0_DACHA|nr:hypothetical protein H072_9064 [Dactylellina haptotyla CBS 200.50]